MKLGIGIVLIIATMMLLTGCGRHGMGGYNNGGYNHSNYGNGCHYMNGSYMQRGQGSYSQ